MRYSQRRTPHIEQAIANLHAALGKAAVVVLVERMARVQLSHKLHAFHGCLRSEISHLAPAFGHQPIDALAKAFQIGQEGLFCRVKQHPVETRGDRVVAPNNAIVEQRREMPKPVYRPVVVLGLTSRFVR
jgi:hypothetical protein